MASGGIRVSVSVSASTKKMIQNIKEITGNHGDEEILAMLEECRMDPDEATQRLLFQDPFHEVKRKRDKKKENASSKDSIEARWKPGILGKGNRIPRGNFSSRYAMNDAVGARNSSKRENGTKLVSKKADENLVSTSHDKKIKESPPVSSSPKVLANGTGVPSEIANAQHGTDSPGSTDRLEPATSPIITNNTESATLPDETKQKDDIAAGLGDIGTQLKSTPSQVRPSSQDNLLVADQKSRQQHGIKNKLPSKSHGVEKGDLTISSQSSRPSSVHNNNSGSRPSSNYGSRAQQIIASQKAGSNKEWKPKSANPNPSQVSGTVFVSEVPVATVEASAAPACVSGVLPSQEASFGLQKKLEDLHIHQRQHVIIPNHIHVPEFEKTKLSFGSFDAGFDLSSSGVAGLENEKTPSQAQDVDDILEEVASSEQNASATEKEGDNPDKPELPSQVPEELSDDGAVSSEDKENGESEQGTALLSGNNQNTVVHTSANYGPGFVSPVPGSQPPPLENNEFHSQTRDVSMIPNFVVQQHFDPASYYAQLYRTTPDPDSRISPFLNPGVATKYNGNVTVLPSHTSQSAQEVGNSLVQSSANPSPPLATQAAGLMQGSLAVNQQPIPLFRPPAGMHISHYPPNYFPYGYFPPFYAPPPTMHQFLNNGTFAQQPQPGTVYPAPSPNNAAGVKYSLPQYKPGTNTNNLAHMGMPNGYGPYGSFPAPFNHGSAPSAEKSNANEDGNPSQLEESNIYSTRQQNEAPVWIAGPGRDVPVSSFYNIAPQGQHVTFAPTQAAHGAYASLYHPAQAVSANIHPLMQQSQTIAGAVDIVRPPANVYQQPQQTQQVNWPNNY